MTKLTDRVALVTAGANRMGLATSKALAALGAQVIVADLDGAAAKKAAEAVRAAAGRATAYAIDVSSPTA